MVMGIFSPVTGCGEVGEKLEIKVSWTASCQERNMPTSVLPSTHAGLFHICPRKLARSAPVLVHILGWLCRP